MGGVSIKVKGEHNLVLSKNDGSFSMLLPNKKIGDSYSLQEVRKKGYELNETSILGRQYVFSDRVPLTIVMVSSAQLLADKQRIENNAYKVAVKSYKQKLALLEEQKETGAIIAEKYREQLQELQNRFENYQSLIDGLAEHYAHTDYDELNDKEREINICIETGNLERADSLLQFLFDPIDVLKRNKEALAKLNEQVMEAEGIIDQANKDLAAVLKQQDKDAEHLYQLYTIALARFDNENAGKYIETRAELDTTNVDWQIEAGSYLQNQRLFDKAEKYYNKALRISRQFAEMNPHANKLDLAISLNKLANLYSATWRFDSCETLYKEALDILREMAFTNSYVYEPYVAQTLHFLARLYYTLHRYVDSEKMYFEATDIYHRLGEANQPIPVSDFVATLNDFAALYYDEKKFDFCEGIYKKILDMLCQLSEESPQEYEQLQYQTLIHLGHIYQLTQCFAEGEATYKKALEILHRLTTANPHAFEPDLAVTYGAMAQLFSNAQRFQESNELYNKSLNIFLRLSKDNPKQYEPNVAAMLGAIGFLKMEMGDNNEAILQFEQALEIYKRRATHMPALQQGYEVSLAMLSGLYSKVNNVKSAYKINEEWIPYLTRRYLDDPIAMREEYVGTLISQSYFSLFARNYSKAEYYAHKALETAPTNHVSYTNLAASLLFQGKFGEAEIIYRQYKDEFKDAFLDDFEKFKAAGVIPKECEAEVERIKKILNE